jgi:hypothetical protein
MFVPCYVATAAIALAVFQLGVQAAVRDQERAKKQGVRSLVRAERQALAQNDVGKDALEPRGAQGSGDATDKNFIHGVTMVKTEAKAFEVEPSIAKTYTTMVMLDYNYRHLFKCWAKLFAMHSSIKTLDVVALDHWVTDYVKDWQKSNAELSITLDTCIPKKGSVAMRWQPPTEHEAVTSLVSSGPSGNGSLPLRGFDADGPAHTYPGPWYSKCFFEGLLLRLNKGINVVHSDLDAFHVGDPWPYYVAPANRNYDLMSGSENWPADASIHGEVLNPGHMLFRNSASVKRILAELIQENDVELSTHGFVWNEQATLGKHLRKQNGGCGKWDKSNTSKMLPGTTIKAWEVVLSGHCGDVNLSVGIVPLNREPCGLPEKCAAKGIVIVHGRHLVMEQLCNATVDLPKGAKDWNEAVHSGFG